jgi:FkbM family methyltransferase
VIAIEPSTPVFSLLEETIQLNALGGNIRRVNAAAARDAGTIPVFSGPTHNIGLTTTVAQRGFGVEGVVLALPLDDVLAPAERPSLRMIKIDVEGAEPDVVRGMTDLIRHAPEELEVLVELSPDWWADQTLTVSDLLQPFLDAGFKIYEIKNSYWPWRYLWPRSVARPMRRRAALPRRAHRLDFILSRRDAERL